MQHDPLVCIDDAIKACELISQFIKDMKDVDFYNDAKTKAAVERQIEIIGGAFIGLKILITTCLVELTIGEKLLALEM